MFGVGETINDEFKFIINKYIYIGIYSTFQNDDKIRFKTEGKRSFKRRKPLLATNH